MKYIIKISIATFLTIATLGFQSAYAGCMRISAASCRLAETVDPSTVIRVGGFVAHRGNNQNTIQLYCPLNLHDVRYQKIDDLNMYHEDTIIAPGDRPIDLKPNILAQIRYVNPKGRIYTFMQVNSFDNPIIVRNDASDGAGYWKSSNSVITNSYLNFNESPFWNRAGSGNFYWIDVYLKRPSLDMKPTFAGVSFCGDTNR